MVRKPYPKHVESIEEYSTREFDSHHLLSVIDSHLSNNLLM